MEEFIENFSEFKDWLYTYYEKQDCMSNKQLVYEIIHRFEELGLDNAF